MNATATTTVYIEYLFIICDKLYKLNIKRIIDHLFNPGQLGLKSLNIDELKELGKCPLFSWAPCLYQNIDKLGNFRVKIIQTSEYIFI